MPAMFGSVISVRRIKDTYSAITEPRGNAVNRALARKIKDRTHDLI